MGVVIDLLAAMQEHLAHSAQQLADAYRQLQSSQAALVQSEKMASLGQMVAGVAHEINTPLAYVRNNVEITRKVFGSLRALVGEYGRLEQMLAGGAAGEDRIAEQLSRLASDAVELGGDGLFEDADALLGDTVYGLDAMRELVGNLRNFSRLDAAKQAEVDLNDCLDQTLIIASHALKGRIEVTKRYGRLPRVTCAPSQINQVFLNILTNAAQSIEHGQGNLLLQTESDGTWVQVHIEDNGKGIPSEHLPRIFDPFFTTKPIGQGTGLGLSIGYQIIKAHGGSIDVASTVGKGSHFVIKLPVADPSAS